MLDRLAFILLATNWSKYVDMLTLDTGCLKSLGHQLSWGYTLTHCVAWFFSLSLLVNIAKRDRQSLLLALSSHDILLPVSCFRRSNAPWSVMIRRLNVTMSWNRGQTLRRSLQMFLCVLIEASVGSYSCAHAQRFLRFEKCIFYYYHFFFFTITPQLVNLCDPFKSCCDILWTSPEKLQIKL